MRSRTVVMFFALFLVGSRYANAQSINGFTSIDYDYSTDTIIGYCETDIDYDLQGEYEARVDCSITNNSTGSEIVALWGDDAGGYNGFTSVLLEVPGAPGTEYTASGINYAVAILIAQEDPYYLYWDTDNFAWFEFQGVYQPLWYNFYGPGPEVTHRQPAQILGTTAESATFFTQSPTDQALFQSLGQCQNDVPKPGVIRIGAQWDNASGCEFHIGSYKGSGWRCVQTGTGLIPTCAQSATQIVCTNQIVYADQDCNHVTTGYYNVKAR